MEIIIFYYQQINKISLIFIFVIESVVGKTNLYNVEPEDLSAITRDTSKATGIPLPGKCA